MKKIYYIGIYISLLTTSYYLPIKPTFASYMLPYPSVMPGNKIYKVMKLVDSAKKYWYWGSIASASYHRELADKFLVEAKTLMEYQQYLLGVDALRRSDEQVQQILPYIKRGKSEGKDMSLQQQKVIEQMIEHERVIVLMKSSVPSETVWTPEKTAATALPLHALLQNAYDIRMEIQKAVVGK